MENFNFHAPTRLVYGKGTESQVGARLSGHTSRLLLLYGGSSIKRTGLYDRVTASLNGSGISYVELGGVVPNPRLSLVYTGIELCRSEGVDMILAVGGGSVIDTAKAIAAGVRYDGDIWDVFESKQRLSAALPVSVVLTIPAAGSELSDNTVITNEDSQRKIGYGDKHLRPFLSIVNPELFYTLPREQISYGTADIMSHIFERYFTNTTRTDLVDAQCEAALRTIMKHAPRLLRNGRDYDSWYELGLSGTLAHSGLLGLGRTEDWACHALEHELSAIYDVAHGAGLAVVTPAWMRYVYRDNINMFLQFAIRVMGVDGGLRSPDDVVLEGIDRLCAFFDTMKLPRTLPDLGIDGQKLELMAKRATGIAYGDERGIGRLKRLLWADALEIYKAAM